jgi:long-subunit acyl-CoA synthetase (AMP-forming)
MGKAFRAKLEAQANPGTLDVEKGEVELSTLPLCHIHARSIETRNGITS